MRELSKMQWWQLQGNESDQGYLEVGKGRIGCSKSRMSAHKIRGMRKGRESRVLELRNKLTGRL